MMRTTLRMPAFARDPVLAVPGASLLRFAAIPAAIVAAVALGWTGYIFSDDHMYFEGALEWARNPPYAGIDHWTTRYPVVLVLAAGILLFGPGEAALAFTSLAWFAAFVAAGAGFAGIVAGRRAGWIAALLLGTMPLGATSASIVYCDLTETALLLAGAGLLALQIGSAPRPALSIAAGICFGLAVLSRETALLALAGFGFLLLFGRPLPRRSLWIAAAGGAAVLAADLVFQGALTGDPLHRYQLALNHDPGLDRAVGGQGNLLVHPILDPLLVLFVNNEFALLFWGAAAAAVAGCHRRLDPIGRKRLLVLAAMAGTSFALIALLSHKLVLNPRYFLPAAAFAAILCAAWLARLRAPVQAPVLIGLLAANFLMLGLQNPHPQWPSEALVAAARAHPGSAITAPAELVRKAALPLSWTPGAAAIGVDAAPLALVEAGAEAGRPVLGRYPAPPRPWPALLEHIGIDAYVPAPVGDALAPPGPDMVLVRTGPDLSF